MANQLAIINNIDLQSNLSTNKNKNIITPFTGFNQRHNPFLNESLKGFFKENATDTDIVDKFGNLYKWDDDGKVYKNGEYLLNVNRSFVKKTLISIPTNIEYVDIRPLSQNKFVYISYDRKVYYYDGTTSTLLYTGDNEHTATFQLDVKSYKDDETTKYISVIDAIYNNENNTELISSVHLSVFSFSDGSLTEVVSKDFTISTALKYFQVGVSKFYLSGENHTYIALRPVNANNSLFEAPAHESTSTVPLIIVCLDDSGYEVNTTISELFFLDFDSADNQLFNVDYYYLNNSGAVYTYAYYYKEFFYGVLSFSISGNQLQVTANSLASTLVSSYEMRGRPLITPTFKFYSRKILINDYVVSTNLCMGYEENSKKDITATFKSSDVKQIVYGGGCTISEDTSADFSRNYSIQLGAFSVVFDSNTVAAISLTTENRDNTLITPWLSVKTDYFMPYLIGGKLFYQAEDGFYILETTASSTYKLLYNRYILFYTNQYCNIYDSETKKWAHFASDWNNRILIGELIPLLSTKGSGIMKGNYSVEIASGLNVNYNISKEKITTAIMQPKLYHNCINFSEIKELYIESTAEFDFYISKSTDTESVTIPKYFKSLSRVNNNLNKFRIKKELNDVDYPIATDGNILLNPSIFFELYETQFQMDYIKEGLNYYTIIYDNGEPYLLFAYGSQLNNVNTLFILQGQPYVLRNNIICAATISNNVVTNISSVISCANMQYLGASVTKAYFFSPVDKYIYTFVGDRKLEQAMEFSEIDKLYKAYYSIDTNTFYILTNKGCYAIVNDQYIYLKKGNFSNIQIIVDGFVLQDFENSKNWTLLRYYGKGDKEPVEFTTALYGNGNNKLSVIDCWYIRLYSDTPKDGKVICSTLTLTEKGTETSEQIFNINSNMWDKETNTYYLRFQPKNQRSVGTSLKVVSDFDIYDLKVSSLPDTAVQLSKNIPKVYSIGGKI